MAYAVTLFPRVAAAAPVYAGGMLGVVEARVYDAGGVVYPLAVGARRFKYAFNDRAVLSSGEEVSLPIEGWATLSYTCFDKAPGVCLYDANGVARVVVFDGSGFTVSASPGAGGTDFIYLDGCLAWIDSQGVHIGGEVYPDVVLSAVAGDKLYVAAGSSVYALDPGAGCSVEAVATCQTGPCRVGWGPDGLVVIDAGAGVVKIGGESYNVSLELSAGGESIDPERIVYAMKLYGCDCYLFAYRDGRWYAGVWTVGGGGVEPLSVGGSYRLAWLYPVAGYDNGPVYNWDFVAGVVA